MAVIKKSSVIGLLLLLFFLGYGIFLPWYSSHKKATFICDKIDEHFNVEDVKYLALSYGLKYFEFKDNVEMDVWIPSQDNPFFRLACVTTFKNGKLMSKEIRADD